MFLTEFKDRNSGHDSRAKAVSILKMLVILIVKVNSVLAFSI